MTNHQKTADSPTEAPVGLVRGFALIVFDLVLNAIPVFLGFAVSLVIWSFLLNAGSLKVSASGSSDPYNELWKFAGVIGFVVLTWLNNLTFTGRLVCALAWFGLIYLPGTFLLS